jgi:BirA family biotin operon repressor/biotin-[acetyl-CoA-carboxylase] ligase
MQSAALAAAGALAPCGAILGLKWPNDLVAYRQNKDGGQKRLVKIGGIIGEQKEGCVILGLGLNIYSAPEIPGRPFPPASLVSLGASNIPDTLALAQSILAAWQSLETLRPEAPPQAAAFRWPSAGDAIQWEGGSGICQGWEADGRLAVLAESGIVLLASADIAAVGDAMNNG